jgi:hypothetical protein
MNKNDERLNLIEENSRDLRAKQRLRTWGMIAINSSGETIASNDISTNLIAVNQTEEEQSKNLQALQELRELCYPNYTKSSRMDKTIVVKSYRLPKS